MPQSEIGANLSTGRDKRAAPEVSRFGVDVLLATSYKEVLLAQLLWSELLRLELICYIIVIAFLQESTKCKSSRLRPKNRDFMNFMTFRINGGSNCGYSGTSAADSLNEIQT
jgi:hypothetical protein